MGIGAYGNRDDLTETFSISEEETGALFSDLTDIASDLGMFTQENKHDGDHYTVASTDYFSLQIAGHGSGYGVRIKPEPIFYDALEGGDEACVYISDRLASPFCDDVQELMARVRDVLIQQLIEDGYSPEYRVDAWQSAPHPARPFFDLDFEKSQCRLALNKLDSETLTDDLLQQRYDKETLLEQLRPLARQSRMVALVPMMNDGQLQLYPIGETAEPDLIGSLTLPDTPAVSLFIDQLPDEMKTGVCALSDTQCNALWPVMKPLMVNEWMTEETLSAYTERFGSIRLSDHDRLDAVLATIEEIEQTGEYDLSNTVILPADQQAHALPSIVLQNIHQNAPRWLEVHQDQDSEAIYNQYLDQSEYQRDLDFIAFNDIKTYDPVLDGQQNSYTTTSKQPGL